MTARIRFEADPRGVAIKPMTRLGGWFETYRNACRGASYDRERRCNVAPIELVPVIVERMMGHKFEIEFSPEVASAVRSTLGDVGLNVEQAKERVSENAAQLYPFQRQGAVKLASRKRFVLADDMGLGKTRQVVFAVPENAPVVIVCPALVKGVWRREFNALRPEFDVTVINGLSNFRWPRRGEVVIVNYDILPPAPLGKCLATGCAQKRRYNRTTCSKHREKNIPCPLDQCLLCGCMRHEGTDCLEIELGGLIAPQGLVIAADEAHMLKTPKSKRTQAFRNLANVARLRSGFTWLVTGTPLLNRVQELWALLECADLAREVFGTYDEFVRVFHGKKNFFGGYDFPKLKDLDIGEDVASKLSAVMLRRSKSEVLPQLPSKAYDDIDVDLGAVLERECDKFIREAHVDISDPAFVEKIPFSQISRLRAKLATVKIPFMEEFVEGYEDADEPLVVFSAHRGPIQRFEKREGWATITGNTSSEERTRIAAAFQAGKLKGVAGTIDAMGVGVTLTRASHALFVDLEWTPALNQQAEDRIHRISQERPVMIHRLVGSHKLERRVIELCTIKSTLIDATINRVSSDADVELPEFAIDMDKLVIDRGNVIRVEDRTKVSAPSSRISRRGPRTPLEQWAAEGLKRLAAADSDRASRRNGIGFKRDDTDAGHSLASQVDQGLSELQWGFAVRLCRPYWRQIGAPPS